MTKANTNGKAGKTSPRVNNPLWGMPNNSKTGHSRESERFLGWNWQRGNKNNNNK